MAAPETALVFLIMAATQPARFGEDWSDERVKSYLNRLPPAGENADFHSLYMAYKHMRPFDFERFLAFFQEAGRDVNARGTAGHTLLELARQHAHSAEFVSLLENAQD